MPYGNTTASTGSSYTNTSLDGSINAESSNSTVGTDIGSSLIANTGFGIGDSLTTGLGNGIELNPLIENSVGLSRSSQFFGSTTSNSKSDENDDLYETEMINVEVNFSPQFSQAQTSVLIKQDRDRSGVLSILENDITLQSEDQPTQQNNEQTITPSTNQRYS